MESKTMSNLDLASTQTASFERFIRLPYRMLSEYLDKRTNELTAFEAFIQMLANVRFEEINEPKGFNSRICQRGESYRSLQAWSDFFHWNKHKTRRFFIKLKNCGLIEHESDYNTTRVRIINYDNYVGYNISGYKENYSIEFESFWKSYHNITLIPATDKITAHKLWTRLSLREREKAGAKIGRYYFSLSKTTYCVKALTYLKNKKFNDEFSY